MLRPAGAALLIIAYLIALHLVTIGRGHAGHEPVAVYLLSIIVFACGSSGATLLVQGRHLLDPVEISDRWISYAPPAMRDTDRKAESDRDLD